HASGGPQAMLGWIFGAVLAMSDGMVWAELGAAFPRAGGSYEYLKEIYGPRSLGRLLSFLYVWQLMMSAPLSAASGCVGIAQYAGFIFPSLQTNFLSHTFQWPLNAFGSIRADVAISHGTLIAICACILAVILAFRRVDIGGKIFNWLVAGVVGAIYWVIWMGMTEFNTACAFEFPPLAFLFSRV